MTHTQHCTIVFQGNLGFNPERRESKNEVGYYVLNVAQSIYKGEGQPSGTNWFRCLIWESSRLAKLIPHLKKGSKVIIAGTLGESVPFISKNGEALVTLNVSVLNLSFADSAKKERYDSAEGHNQAAENVQAEENVQPEDEYPPF